MKCDGCGKEFMTGQTIISIAHLRPDTRSGLSQFFTKREPNRYADYDHLCVCENCLGATRAAAGKWKTGTGQTKVQCSASILRLFRMGW